jgi:hypothetical protein
MVLEFPRTAAENAKYGTDLILTMVPSCADLFAVYRETPYPVVGSIAGVLADQLTDHADEFAESEREALERLIAYLRRTFEHTRRDWSKWRRAGAESECGKSLWYL